MAKNFPITLLTALVLPFALTACSGGGGSSLSFQSDRDGDGIPDAAENRDGTDLEDPNDPYPGGDLDVLDATGPGPDALPDGLERYLVDRGALAPVTAATDTDLDGIPDYLELRRGFDFADFADPLPTGAGDLENDSGPALDGVSDGLEFALLDLGAAPPLTLATDTDGDFIPDVQEVRAGSDPLDATDPAYGRAFDLDRDGLPDALELATLSSPLDPDFPVFQGDQDADGGLRGPDGDAFPDGLEGFLVAGGAQAPVTTLSDTDGDGIGDHAEVLGGTDPFDRDVPVVDGHLDSDGDGISDALERFLVDEGALGPITPTTDTDGDRFADVLELAAGFDPFDATQPGLFDHFDLDGDGLVDLVEIAGAGDPLDADSPVLGGAEDTNDLSGPADDPLTDAVEAELIARGALAPVTALTDSDLDGITDLLELRLASNPLDADDPLAGGNLDQNPATGVIGDGITDALESVLVGLGSLAPISSTTASDGDIIPDVIEMITGTQPFDDNDPLAGRVSDVDGDGAPDYFELLFGADPLDPDSPIPGGSLDTDDDGLSDTLENLLAADGSLPPISPATDSDGDGLADYLEVLFARDPRDRDNPVPGGGDTEDRTGPPGDGISDALELYLVNAGAEAPITAITDTDGDAIPDVIETSFGVSPFDATDPLLDGVDDDDGDGVSNALEFVLVALGADQPVDGRSDTDNDGAPDYLELLSGFDAFRADSPVAAGLVDADEDGVFDALEAVMVILGASEPVNGRTDTDGDGAPDYLEVRFGSNPVQIDHPLVGGAADVNDATGPPDTISDTLESILIALGAVAPLDQLSDTDRDRAPDYLEALAATDSVDGDAPIVQGRMDNDADLMSEALEFVLVRLGVVGPINLGSDSDGDGAPDYFEVLLASHPVDADDPVPGGSARGFDENNATGPPLDGISDALEALLIRGGSSAPLYPATDIDGDGMPDYLEVRGGSNPFDPTSPLANGADDREDGNGPAGDGISDLLELYLVARGAIAPVTLTSDSDLDGAPDWVEVFKGTDPLDTSSTPPMGTQPRAESVAVDGVALLGRTLTGVYLYADDDFDPEGDSLLEWRRDGIPIEGETGLTYVIRNADLGATLTFAVQPVSRVANPLDTLEGTLVEIDIPVAEDPFPVGDEGPGGVGTTDGTSDLIAWFRADRGVSTVDVGGTSEISRLRDLSGQGLDAVEVSGAMRPELVASTGPRGGSALRFSGNQTLTFPRPSLNAFTAIVAFETSQSVPSTTGNFVGRPAFFGGADINIGRHYHMGVQNGRVVFTVTGTEITGTNPVSDSIPHIAEAYRIDGDVNDGRMRLFVDSDGEGFADGTGNAQNGSDTYFLGANSPNNGFFDGDIYEIMFFTRTISVTERRILREYLIGRHGGMLQGTQLYDFGATHGRDVAGIGGENEDTRLSASQGTGIVQMSNASEFSDGDYLLWGSSPLTGLDPIAEAPAPFTFRLPLDWRFQVTDGGNGDGIGMVSIRFDVDGLFLSPVASDFALLLDEDGDFSNAVLHTTGANYDAANERIQFSNVDLSGFSYFSLAIRPL